MLFTLREVTELEEEGQLLLSEGVLLLIEELVEGLYDKLLALREVTDLEEEGQLLLSEGVFLGAELLE